MTYLHVDAVYKRSTSKGATRAVAAYIAHRTTRGGLATVTYGEIVAACAVSKQTAITAVKKLESLTEIETIERGNGRNNRSTYRFLLPVSECVTEEKGQMTRPFDEEKGQDNGPFNVLKGQIDEEKGQISTPFEPEKGQIDSIKGQMVRPPYRKNRKNKDKKELERVAHMRDELPKDNTPLSEILKSLCYTTKTYGEDGLYRALPYAKRLPIQSGFSLRPNG